MMLWPRIRMLRRTGLEDADHDDDDEFPADVEQIIDHPAGQKPNRTNETEKQSSRGVRSSSTPSILEP